MAIALFIVALACEVAAVHQILPKSLVRVGNDGFLESDCGPAFMKKKTLMRREQKCSKTTVSLATKVDGALSQSESPDLTSSIVDGGTYYIRNTKDCQLNGSSSPWCQAQLTWDPSSALAQHPMAALEVGSSSTWVLQAVYGSNGALDGYYIRNRVGCDLCVGTDNWCNAYLSWDSTAPYPHASLDNNNAVVWKVEAVTGGYSIQNRKDCSAGSPWCNAGLSWDDVSDFHPRVTVEVDDHVVWNITQAPAVTTADCHMPPTPAPTPPPTPAPTPAPIVSDGNIVVIKSTSGCPSGDWCNAELSWDGGGSHPMASVEHNDPVTWKLEADDSALAAYNDYRIKSQYGCSSDPPGDWCNAELSWDGGDPHPMASVEFNDPVVWRIEATTGGYKIINKYGCPAHTWCDAELSWDSRSGSHPRASVEFNDPVVWAISLAT